MRKYILNLLCIFSLLLYSCSDALNNIKPRDQISQDDLSPEDIEKLLNGVYAQMETFIFNYWFHFDIQGENYKAGPGGNLFDPVSMTPSDASILNSWQRAFTTLSQVNFLVESYEDRNDPENFADLGGTAYYFRALIYYNLAVRWGTVPIIEKRTYDIIPLSSEEDVWAFVEENIEKALSLLSGYSSRYYVSKVAAQALAARIYLATGNKTKALENAEAVLTHSSFRLAATSEEFALPYVVGGTVSPEVLFALANKRTSSYLLFVGSLNDVDASWNYAPSDWAYSNLFADDTKLNRVGDIREIATFSATDPNRVIKFPNGMDEYQLVPTEDYSNTPIVIARLAEMYLIKAELLGKQDGTDVLLEFLEKRYTSVPAKSSIQSLSDTDYQSLILNERRREFFGEGYQWYDVKRTNRTDLLETLNGRTYLLYFPIPQNEIDLAGEDLYPQHAGYR